MRGFRFRKTDLRQFERVHFTGADFPILVGAIPPWLPRWLVAKRVGTGARPLPDVEGCLPDAPRRPFHLCHGTD